MDYPTIFVCLMGMGTVFFGLICLIALTYLMSFLLRRKAAPSSSPAPAAAAAPTAPEPNQEELIAAVSAAIAEDLGTDITGIRIVSMKKL